MPIISTIGRKHWRTRCLIAAIYVLLTLGAVTMIYPFLIMLAGTTKSGVDTREFTPIPRFLLDDTVLYQKHIEGLFNESVSLMRSTYGGDGSSFEAVLPPISVNDKMVSQWFTFLEDAHLPTYTRVYGYVDALTNAKVTPLNLRLFREQIVQEFNDDLSAANLTLHTTFTKWYFFRFIPVTPLLRRDRPLTNALAIRYRQFTESLPRWSALYLSAEGFYKNMFLKVKYTQNITEYNRQHDTSYKSYDEIHLTRRLPEGSEKEKQDWELFVRNTLNLFWIRPAPQAAPLYQQYLRAKYPDIEALNSEYGTDYTSLAAVPLVQEPPLEGRILSDWEAFVTGWKSMEGEIHQLPIQMIHIHSVDFMFRDYLQERFADINSLNQQLGTDFTGYLDIIPPQQQAHYTDFLQERSFLRWEFTKRNFIEVNDYLLRHGRGIINTVIYCGLSVALALLVNPLAAYALSRHKPPSGYKLLLFLMLTMAFPPMVTQIPVFLLLRKLHLLNTFAALVLPGVANGYQIFLLKGFFDSLPRELYESAALDGAGESRMFGLTLTLSKPILAVVALHAFTGAYSSFMFALLLCQDDKMWTIMVWLYQLQMNSGIGVMYASLILAAIPTFVIFVFCQNIIMRGIVVPTEK